MLNEMTFDSTIPNELKAAHKFIRLLIDQNINSMTVFNDIHIKQEETFIVVQWSQFYYEFSEDFDQGRFAYIDDEHTIVKEKIMPDNSTLCIFEGEDEEEAVMNWYKENPGWVKKGYTWVNAAEGDEVN